MDLVDDHGIAEFRLTVLQHHHAGGGAGHDASQKAEGGPVVNAAGLAIKLAGYQAAGKLIEIVEESGVAETEIVVHLACLALRERRIAIRPFAHVTPTTLDVMAGEGFPLALGGCCRIQIGEFRIEEAEQRLEFFGFSAVRSGS